MASDSKDSGRVRVQIIIEKENPGLRLRRWRTIAQHYAVSPVEPEGHNGADAVERRFARLFAIWLQGYGEWLIRRIKDDVAAYRADLHIRASEERRQMEKEQPNDDPRVG